MGHLYYSYLLPLLECFVIWDIELNESYTMFIIFPYFYYYTYCNDYYKNMGYLSWGIYIGIVNGREMMGDHGMGRFFFFSPVANSPSTLW